MALDEITLSIDIIESKDKYPSVKQLLQLAKCQAFMKLYNDAILTLLRAHQENERGFQLNQIANNNDSSNIGNYKIKINDMLRKFKKDMRDYDEKNSPITKEILPIIEYKKPKNKINNTLSPCTVGSIVSTRGSPNTTVSSVSNDSYDSSDFNPNTSTSLQEETSNSNCNSKAKNSKVKNGTKKTKTTILLPSLKPKVKINFPKYKAGVQLRAVIERERERSQEIFKESRKASESTCLLLNSLGKWG